MSGNNIDGSNGSFVDPNATYTNSAMEDFIDIVDPTNKTSGLDIANRNGKFIEELTTYKDIEIEDLYQQLLQQGLIDENVLPLSTAKGIFKGSGSTIIDGQELKITNETAIKKTMLEVLATGSGNGKTSSELFAEFGLTYNDPQPGSLTALQSRVWYLENEKLIKVKKDAFVELNPQATLREQAEFCVNERNRLRKVTREAMQDAEMRDYLNAAEQKTLDDLVNNKRQKLAKTKGVELHEITDDEVYKAIINSSDQSRTPLNDFLGIGRNN